MAFRGWPAEALEFFDGLAADNSKAYWQAHKPIYDAVVRQPMDELLAELGGGKVFRPNRDIRFSADKSPYKENIAAMVGDLGYVQVSVGGLGVGSGMYSMAPDQLERYRRAVDHEGTGPELVGIIAVARKAGVDVAGHGTLKTVPRGFPKDHPRAELLRHKGLIVWKEWPPAAWLGTKAAKKRIVDVLAASQPLNAWLKTNVANSAI